MKAPTNRLKIVFKNFFVTSDDTGDFFTASSYPTDSQELIPVDRNYGQSVNDLIDIRPRVAEYNTSHQRYPHLILHQDLFHQGLMFQIL